jgi:hypothetical protein
MDKIKIGIIGLNPSFYYGLFTIFPNQAEISHKLVR